MTTRVCWVTGGASGIGRACVQYFAEHGWHVIAADVDGEAANAAAHDIAGRSSSDILGIRCDVTRQDDCHAVAQAALQRWGRIDALIGNAGVQLGGRILDASDTDWARLVDVNLRGIVHACRAALPTMIAQRDGRIVLVSSINAVLSPAAMGLYDMTKTGVLGLTRSLAG